MDSKFARCRHCFPKPIVHSKFSMWVFILRRFCGKLQDIPLITMAWDFRFCNVTTTCNQENIHGGQLKCDTCKHSCSAKSQSPINSPLLPHETSNQWQILQELSSRQSAGSHRGLTSVHKVYVGLIIIIIIISIMAYLLCRRSPLYTVKN